MKRVLTIFLGVSLLWSTPGFAQDQAQTLADIRQELSILHVEIQRLKRELSTTGGASANFSGGSTLERLDSIEFEMQSLTSKTEQLENRINRVVADGTNRIGDLEFRLVELEGGDLGAIGETTTLGGDTTGTVTAVPIQNTNDTQMAVGEQSDFTRAQEALAQGSFRSAADQFATFTQTYPGGPLSAEAHFLRGEALEALDEMAPAARAYLASFSSDPEGAQAPRALYKLGTSLEELGQHKEACVTLNEVEIRFPDADAVLESRSALRNLGCN
jgi:tol-pal system protein YbgF